MHSISLVQCLGTKLKENLFHSGMHENSILHVHAVEYEYHAVIAHA